MKRLILGVAFVAVLFVTASPVIAAEAVTVELTDIATGEPIACSEDQDNPTPTTAGNIRFKGVFSGFNQGGINTKASFLQGGGRSGDGSNIWYQDSKQSITGPEANVLIDVDQRIPASGGVFGFKAGRNSGGTQQTCWIEKTGDASSGGVNAVLDGDGEESVVSMSVTISRYADPTDVFTCGEETERVHRVRFTAYLVTQNDGDQVDTKFLYTAVDHEHQGDHAHWLQATPRMNGTTDTAQNNQTKVITGVQNVTAPGPHEFRFSTFDESVVASCTLTFPE